MLTAPFYGTCERALEKTIWLQIEMLYRIEPSWERSGLELSVMENFDLVSFGETAIIKLERNSELASKGCVGCSHSVWASMELSETSASIKNLTLPAYFVVHLIYLTDGNCGQDVISRGLQTLLGTELQVTMSKGVPIKFSISLERQSIDDVLMKTSLTFSKINQPCTGGSTVYLSQSELCPIITLTDEDYVKLMEIASARKQVNELFGMDEEEAFVPDRITKNVTVCLEDYRAMFMENALNTAMQLQSVEVYATTTVIFIFFLLVFMQ